MNPKAGHVIFVIAFLLIGINMLESGGLSMMLAGVWALFYALWVAKIRRYIIDSGIRVKGSIFNNESDGEGGLFSVYKFTAHSGKVITGGTFIPTHGGEIGNTVSIMYHPKYPKSFLVEEKLASSKQYAIARIIVSAIIIFFFVSGYCLFPK